MGFPLGKWLGKAIDVLKLVKGIVNILSRKQSEKDETKVIWRSTDGDT